MDLESLFGKYTDTISDVYEDLMHEYQTKGLKWGLMLTPQFFTMSSTIDLINKDEKLKNEIFEKMKLQKEDCSIEKVLGELPFLMSLPTTHSRIKLGYTKEQFEEAISKLKEEFAKVPELQGRKHPEMVGIREVLDQYFYVYHDDLVEFSISYGHKTIVKKQGHLGKLTFQIKDLTNNPQLRLKQGDMVTVKIVLLEKGEQRIEEEKKAFIGEADFYFDGVLSALFSVQYELMNQELKEKRFELIGSNDLSQNNFNNTDVVVIEEMVNALQNSDLTNEQVLAQAKCMRMIGLQKMREWLNRFEEDEE